MLKLELCNVREFVQIVGIWFLLAGAFLFIPTIMIVMFGPQTSEPFELVKMNGLGCISILIGILIMLKTDN